MEHNDCLRLYTYIAVLKLSLLKANKHNIETHICNEVQEFLYFSIRLSHIYSYTYATPFLVCLHLKFNTKFPIFFLSFHRI